MDWYIEQLRRKVNNSPAIKMSIPQSAYKGNKRNVMMVYTDNNDSRVMDLRRAIKFMGEDHPLPLASGNQTESYIPARKFVIPIDTQKMLANNALASRHRAKMTKQIEFSLPGGKNQYIKDETAILDIISSNINERPIYFAVTCRESKFMGLGNYLALEGLAFRIVPLKGGKDGSLGMIGNGSVNEERMYDNIMNKFKWGNFEESYGNRLYVDRSYLPSVQSHRLTMIRLARVFASIKQPDKALEILNQYFKAFPHKNFPYDYNAFYVIQEYGRINKLDEAKPHIKTLAMEMGQRMKFYDSLDKEDLASGFAFDKRQATTVIQGLYSLLGGMKDEAFKKEIEGFIGAYKPSGTLPN